MGFMTTGIRLWISLMDGAALVVMMVHDLWGESSSDASFGFQVSHKPAKANGSPEGKVM